MVTLLTFVKVYSLGLEGKYIEFAISVPYICVYSSRMTVTSALLEDLVAMYILLCWLFPLPLLIAI